MIETGTPTIIPTVRPILEVVRNQFEAWRKRRRCRGESQRPYGKQRWGCARRTLFLKCPEPCDSITMA